MSDSLASVSFHCEAEFMRTQRQQNVVVVNVFFLYIHVCFPFLSYFIGFFICFCLFLSSLRYFILSFIFIPSSLSFFVPKLTLLLYLLHYSFTDYFRPFDLPCILLFFTSSFLPARCICFHFLVTVLQLRQATWIPILSLGSLVCLPQNQFH
jgi:hypothetical protein